MPTQNMQQYETAEPAAQENSPSESQEPVAEDAQSDQPTPQAQQNFEKLVLAGLRAMYSEQTHQGIVQMLSQRKDNPPKALADMVFTIMEQLYKKSGGKMPPEIILPAAAELIGEAANLAATAKIFQSDEKTIAVAMQRFIATLFEKYGVDKDALQRFMQSIPQDQIQAAVKQQQSLGGAPNAAPTAQPTTAQPAPAAA